MRKVRAIEVLIFSRTTVNAWVRVSDHNSFSPAPIAPAEPTQHHMLFSALHPSFLRSQTHVFNCWNIASAASRFGSVVWASRFWSSSLSFESPCPGYYLHLSIAHLERFLQLRLPRMASLLWLTTFLPNKSGPRQPEIA